MEKLLTIFLSVLGILAVTLLMAFSAENDKAVDKDLKINVNDDATGSFAVVELFTSEGCSSCPPADKVLGKLVDDARQNGKRIFALAFHVDYWDYLGWKDLYSSASYSQRQKEYANAFQSNRIYTPQMIVNGENEFVGSSQYKAKKYIEDALHISAKVHVTVSTQRAKNGQISVSYSTDTIPANSIINFALVERNIVREIKRGENNGRTLHHDNVVRSFKKMRLQDKQGNMTLQMPEDGVAKNSSVIVYVQNGSSMKVLGAEGTDLSMKLQ